MSISCSRCGTENRDNAPHCISCGAPLTQPQTREPVFQQPVQPTYQKPCIRCNALIGSNLAVCPYCGTNQMAAPVGQHNKLVAGLLAILLGSIGAHKFYLGQTGQGIIYLLLCWTFIPGVIGVIEGIIYLSMSDAAFYQKYG